METYLVNNSPQKITPLYFVTRFVKGKVTTIPTGLAGREYLQCDGDSTIDSENILAVCISHHSGEVIQVVCVLECFLQNL